MTGTSYEAAVQREMLDMATKAGALAAELRIARITLGAILPHIDGWPKDELAEVVSRIDRAIAEAEAETSHDRSR